MSLNDETPTRVQCWNCGVRLELAIINPEPIDEIVYCPECPCCGENIPMPDVDQLKAIDITDEAR